MPSLTTDDKRILVDILKALTPEQLLIISGAGTHEVQDLVNEEVQRRTTGCTIWSNRRHRYDEDGFCKCGASL
jgi:hypothetical protein